MILDKNDRGKILPEHSGMISVRYDKGRLEGQGNFYTTRGKSLFPSGKMCYIIKQRG